jgi:hypothetical protein
VRMLVETVRASCTRGRRRTVRLSRRGLFCLREPGDARTRRRSCLREPGDARTRRRARERRRLPWPGASLGHQLGEPLASELLRCALRGERQGRRRAQHSGAARLRKRLLEVDERSAGFRAELRVPCREERRAVRRRVDAGPARRPTRELRLEAFGVGVGARGAGRRRLPFRRRRVAARSEEREREYERVSSSRAHFEA